MQNKRIIFLAALAVVYRRLYNLKTYSRDRIILVIMQSCSTYRRREKVYIGTNLPTCATYSHANEKTPRNFLDESNIECFKKLSTDDTRACEDLIRRIGRHSSLNH